ncbi:MAG: RNA ligase family protein [Eubacteriaceae bacterium]|nr:RNA ligase family protein [Eubacteriaceae bacterium]
MINSIIDSYGIDKLNTLTKYPSILTYHALGEKGSLVEQLSEDKSFVGSGLCYITEKIDGTNARVIFGGEDYIIGSREELLYAKGDRIINPALGIVGMLKPIAEKLGASALKGLYVMYGEVYGGNVTAASKQYTNDKTFGFRMFDVAYIGDLGILDEPINKISAWRESENGRFYNVDKLMEFAGLHDIATVPYLSDIDGAQLPIDRISTYKFLESFTSTKAGINNIGQSEGIVIRDNGRQLIRKIRFEDYQRTAKKEKWEI